MKALICDPREWPVWPKMFHHLKLACCLALLALMTAPAMHAAGDEDDEFDSYKVRLEGFWFYSKPTGHFSSAGRNGLLDLERDIGFRSYSTGVGKIDWKFTHKNHLYLMYYNFTQTKSTVLNRTVVFQGQTYNIGTAAAGSLETKIYVPGYQYDFIRRKQGSLGVQVQLNVIDVIGKLSAAAQVNNGVLQAANFSSADLRAPLPVAGPITRIYLIPGSGRLFLDANLLGMYFFGYGNYVSTMGTLGFTVVKHVAIRGGYSLGSRFDIKTKTDRVGVTLSQHGALAGLELSF